MKGCCFYECDDDCDCQEEGGDSKKCCSNCCRIRLAIGITVLLAVVVVGVLRLRK